MNVSGVAKISSGEYEHIFINGVGELDGDITCITLSVSGVAKGKGVRCTEDIKVSGCAYFSGSLDAKSIHVSGMLGGTDKILAEDISVAGSIQHVKGIECDTLDVSGVLGVKELVTAKKVECKGSFCCGAITADEVNMQWKGKVKAFCIEAAKVVLRCKKGLFRKRARVRSHVKGEEIIVEHLCCPLVAGTKVTIGKKCRIDVVQYKESVEISPKAKVKKIEKI